MPTQTRIINAKAVNTGFKDALLVFGFSVLAYILTYAVTLLPFLDTFQDGRYAWVKAPLALLIASIVKGIDRKRHEDAGPSTGLVDI